jgi:hypothetical protein
MERARARKKSASRNAIPIVLILWWGIATSLGIAAIVALEPLWNRLRAGYT